MLWRQEEELFDYPLIFHSGPSLIVYSFNNWVSDQLTCKTTMVNIVPASSILNVSVLAC